MPGSAAFSAVEPLDDRMPPPTASVVHAATTDETVAAPGQQRGRLRRKKPPGTRAFLGVTQNVRGLAKTAESIGLWFAGFRQRTELGQADVVFLQETRATSQWADKLADQHAREWGLRPEQLDHPLSFWHPTPSASGGVAILFKLHGVFSNPTPVWQSLWSPWFMAVSATMLGEPVTLVNVYGPSGKSKVREELFRALQDIPRPSGTIILGGDFNCTLDDELDRSRRSAQSHDSPALHGLLARWELVDVLASDMAAVTTEADKLDFHARHHTYRYQLADGSLASSRLDRWYVSANKVDRVTRISADPPVNHSDHEAVSIVFNVRARSGPKGRRRRPRLRYPLPFGCRSAISELTTEAVTKFEHEFSEADGAISAKAWDELKSWIRRSSLTSIRTSLKRQRRGIRQRRRRLQSALRAALYAAGPRPRRRGSVEGLVDGLSELSLDPYAKVVGLRRAIIRLDRRRARARRKRRFALHAASTPEAERAFFQRFRVRQGYQGPIDLPVTAGADPRVAERLASDWSTITQRGATGADDRDAFFACLPFPSALPQLELLDQDFTQQEVRAALEACPRGKAPGPDGLPNDWYRDHCDLLVPVLTALLNQWHRHRTLPGSFRTATVACIPKTKTPQTGLDFRPIALLDTDYKIYARLLLNRLSPRLPELVAPTQFGFVAGRQVHDALDIFHGLQSLVRRGEASTQALAVLLDFAKAYDTLDRAFLLRVLERLGFPAGFLGAVNQMHLHTTAEYAADDTISSAHPVLNGIRQGCPLAPTLFVLAVNTLYESIGADPAIHGVRLPSGEEICATGYADDTTCYVEDGSSIRPLQLMLDRFGAASGLRVNVAKSTVVALSPHADTFDSLSFPVAAASAASRLLGGQVATTDVTSFAWSTTLQQVRARLHWAELKTTNEIQRVKLLRAILLPKFLFVVRHHWPSAATIEKFQRLIDDYVWGGSLRADGDRKRAWMSRQVARSPVHEGGLNVPQLTHELQVLSLATVERWAQPATGAPPAICHELLRVTGAADGILAPSRRPAPSSLSVRSTLAATGRQLRRALAATPRSADELALLTPLLTHVGRGTSVDYEWDHGWLRCRYERIQALLLPLRNYQGAHYGNVQAHALLESRLSGEDILLLTPDKTVTPADFQGLFNERDRLKDVLELRWDDDGRVCFRAVKHESPLLPHRAVAFRRLCDTVIANYPGLLRPPAQPEDLVFRPATLDLWRLVPTAVGFRLDWSPVDQAVVPVGPVYTTADATAAARRALGVTSGSFERHAWLDAPFALWTGVRGPSPDRARAFLRSPSASRCEAEQTGRQRRWDRMDAEVAAALETVEWTTLLSTAGAPAAHRLLFHKLKGDRLSGWDRVHELRGCPHCPDIGAAGGEALHIVWACPKAQERWQQLLDFWAPLWTSRSTALSSTTKEAVFGLHLHQLPDKLWSHPALLRLGTPTAHDTIATGLALDAVWRRQVLVTVYTIWRWRVEPDTVDEIWSASAARARHGAGLQAVSHDVRWSRTLHSAATKFTAAALDVLFGSTSLAPPTAPPAGADARFLLFFDGGSRGNPGPGGSGAVVVRVDASSTQAAIVWSAAMAHGSSSTTNNVAEYQGLLTGLKAATAHGWRPLEIVGDSQLILRQMASYRPPKNHRLLELYAPARRLADALQVRRWTHHRRAYNTMADAAANLAMDLAASSQTSSDHHGSVLANNTYSGGGAASVGQIFFDQDLLTEVNAISPYSTITDEVVVNADDSIFVTAASNGFDPIMQYVLLGDSLSDGLFAWISVGVDTSISKTVSAAAAWTANGGVATSGGFGGGMGMGSGAPGGMGSGTFPGSGMGGMPPSGSATGTVAPSTTTTTTSATGSTGAEASTPTTTKASACT